jgi:hypothetical protein
MEKGIVLQGYLPLRKEPTGTAEMVSQVLFGEEFQILDQKDGWVYISLDFDASEGWVGVQSVYPANTQEQGSNGAPGSYRMVAHPISPAYNITLCQQLLLPAGAIWPESKGKLLSLHGYEFEIQTEEHLVLPESKTDPEEVGRRLISIPKIRGGRSGFGFDSAGLLQMLCRLRGIVIPREFSKQSELGTTINFMHEIKKGDLAFFDNEEGEIIHAGMILDGGRILHASTTVRIDRFDFYGIYCMEKENYSYKLRVVKRVKSP